ncbi:MAG: hypothetical protein ACRD29_22340 [Acidimicrobiales bacterium]
MAGRRRSSWRDDGGFIGGIEVLPFGILVFVVGILLVANAWAVIDARLAAGSAAREAARTYVETVTGDDSRGATQAAGEAARAAFLGHGRDPEAMGFVIDPPGAVARCQPIHVTVSYEIRAVTIPFIGGLGSMSVAATHTEIIDPFRNDVATSGAAPCA